MSDVKISGHMSDGEVKWFNVFTKWITFEVKKSALFQQRMGRDGRLIERESPRITHVAEFLEGSAKCLAQGFAIRDRHMAFLRRRA